MELLTQDEINDIRKSVDIVDVVSTYLPLTAHGKNYFGVCPFHNDNNPSMSVSKEKQIFKCFSCGARGNVFTFVEKYENVSFIEAVKKVCDIAKINIDINIKPTKKKDFTILYEIYDLSLKLYQNNINTNQGISAKEYLKKRLIDEDTIKEFQIGLSLKNHTLLTNLLHQKEFSYSDMIESGLIIQNEYGYNDIYYNRIMFPLHDLSGQVVGYSGRIYENDSTSKYINTKETKIFKKGELIYNYHRAKDIARKMDEVIIVEGFMDTIRLHISGIKNVVALMGTSLTKVQANLIKRLSSNVIIMLDGDSPGSKATESISKELINIGIVPKVVRLEEELDPDEYIIKYGTERLKAKLENPISLTEFKLSFYKQDKNMLSTTDKADYINQVIKSLNEINDDILKELTLVKISEETHIDIDLLRSKIIKKEEVIPKIDTSNKEIKDKGLIKAEISYIYHMINNKEAASLYRKIRYFPTEKYRLLARTIYKYYLDNHEVNEADISSFLDSELLETMNSILNLELKEEYSTELINGYIDTINRFNTNSEIKRLMEKLKNEIEESKQQEILREIAELRGDSND